MKTEFLILIPSDESYCNSKKAFVDLLNVDDLISVSNQKVAYRRTVKSKDLLSVRFQLETNKVQFKEERYFLFILEYQDESLIDEFSELCERIKIIAKRISPGATAINTIWDDVGRIYAEKSYPVINEVENLMRKLIAKFMLINVGMTWSKEVIHPDLFKKIENFEEEELYLNDLHKLDFIHLKQVLFEKKRDISLQELDRTLIKTSFSVDDKEKILRYVPRSNWEKYFSALLNGKDSSLEKKWELLYKLRNKVAHNRNVNKEEFEKIKGLSSDIREIINKATTKLGEIDIKEEDQERIKHLSDYDSMPAMFRSNLEISDKEFPYSLKTLMTIEILKKAIQQKSVISFEYEKPGKETTCRVGNPHALFVMCRKDGTTSPMLHIVQTSGHSNGEQYFPSFKMFQVEYISNVTICDPGPGVTFETSPLYNSEWDGYKSTVAKV